MFQKFVPLTLLIASTVCFADHHKAPPEGDDMKVIFNGKNLDGWSGDSRLWSVKDGVIHGETTPEVKANGNTFLIWKDGTLEDFDLRLSFEFDFKNDKPAFAICYVSLRLIFSSWLLKRSTRSFSSSLDYLLSKVSDFFSSSLMRCLLANGIAVFDI